MLCENTSGLIFQKPGAALAALPPGYVVSKNPQTQTKTEPNMRALSMYIQTMLWFSKTKKAQCFHGVCLTNQTSNLVLVPFRETNVPCHSILLFRSNSIHSKYPCLQRKRACGSVGTSQGFLGKRLVFGRKNNACGSAGISQGLLKLLGY